MSVDLYVVKRRSVEVLSRHVKTVRFLQLAVENALAQDSQMLVEAAVRSARREWEELDELPQFVVQVGKTGFAGPGAPIFKWPFFKRSYCFDHELAAPFGYLGERGVRGFCFRTPVEQACINVSETARRIDEGSATVYKNFWQGEVFVSGEEFLRARGQGMQPGGEKAVSPRALKILDLIRFIQEKGKSASPADLHFLGSLREKAAQLGCTC
ncbi:MAG: hypothetical protein ACP5SH_08305 [Syntrophobacteraceae bacterium]